VNGDLYGIRVIAVGIDHAHYPPEPNSMLIDTQCGRAYVRDDEWTTLRAALVVNSGGGHSDGG
jgi:hypothetical protein